ncbi:MAG: hypothetical protein K0S61_4446 [Anaerocolumna sp.]|nr:hypothetical protein [Anaerocolumna sp.]
MEELRMKTDNISKEEARQFLVSYHNLNDSQNYDGLEGVLKYLTKVRSIQYDPLNVVGRNADLVLQSRVKNYKPEILQTLLYKERRFIDGFDKEMCIYLAEDFPRFELIRELSGYSTKNTLANRNQLDALNILDEVRNYIIINGAISSKDISIGKAINDQSNEDNVTNGNTTNDKITNSKVTNEINRWGHRKLSSAALDYLYTTGELCVVNKSGTQKVYDFTEKVLPQLNRKNLFNNHDEFMSWYIKRRIGSVGFLWDKNGGAWQGHFLSDKKKREETLKILCEKGELIQLFVEDIKTPFYVLKGEEALFLKSNQDKKVKFLAPLDNMIWDREMTKQLFDFEYSWEVYTPVTKRKYGYYVLPVLYDNKLIARFEPEKIMKNTPFQIKHWWWEPKVIKTKELLSSIDIAIQDFSRYLGVEYSKDYTGLLQNQGY